MMISSFEGRLPLPTPTMIATHEIRRHRRDLLKPRHNRNTFDFQYEFTNYSIALWMNGMPLKIITACSTSRPQTTTCSHALIPIPQANRQDHLIFALNLSYLVIFYRPEGGTKRLIIELAILLAWLIQKCSSFTISRCTYR